jgi:iron(III) transport system substrate-binding protein
MKLPAGFPARDTIKVLPINAAEALKNTDKDLKTFTDLFGSK